jgi:type II secretory pathway component PulJ
VTLLEIMLAMGLLVVVSSMTYWFYASSLESGREGTAAAQKIRLVRVVLERMAREIRQAATITIDNQVGVRGDPERIWLSTVRVPSREQSEDRTLREGPPPGEYDLKKVEYKIVRHPEILDEEEGFEYPLGLARVEKLIPRPDAAAAAQKALEEGESDESDSSEEPSDGEEEEEGDTEILPDELLASDEEEVGDADLAVDIEWDELYAPEIRFLRFCYYDGHKWWDSWEVGGENPLPQLIQVTVGFEPHPPFGEERGLDEINEEFCTCRNEDPVECEPLALDQYSMVVRLPQSDPLFRSRISRETQGFIAELASEPEE